MALNQACLGRAKLAWDTGEMKDGHGWFRTTDLSRVNKNRTTLILARFPCVQAGNGDFVRDPALLRAARATADDTTIFMVGGPIGVPYIISRWEARLP